MLVAGEEALKGTAGGDHRRQFVGIHGGDRLGRLQRRDVHRLPGHQPQAGWLSLLPAQNRSVLLFTLLNDDVAKHAQEGPIALLGQASEFLEQRQVPALSARHKRQKKILGGHGIGQRPVALRDLDLELFGEIGQAVTLEAGHEDGGELKGVDADVVGQHALPMQKPQVHVHAVPNDRMVLYKGEYLAPQCAQQRRAIYLGLRDAAQLLDLVRDRLVRLDQRRIGFQDLVALEADHADLDDFVALGIEAGEL